MLESVLVANRGEIAVRVVRACRELGVRAVAVYSDVDRDAMHVRIADEAYRLGPADPSDSYLAIDRVVDLARHAGVDAIHPGYGFLAESAAFADAVVDAGLVFVGPPAHVIRRVGDKLAARAAASIAGVPVVPGTDAPTDEVERALEFAGEHGYPIAVKAIFGGGGRGMKIVRDAASLAGALASARREAQAAFGRDECYLERYLERPRHVEVQVLADMHGTVLSLADRDCSLQRRHQKLLEEAPAPAVDDDVRARLADAAVRIAREVGYVGAGTCEFLLDGDEPFFLEMNARLQVEHPVTELVTGIDLVHAQLRIADGQPLGLAQSDVVVRGHAIEARINAEDPATGFLPCPGTVRRLRVPDGPWVRVDSGIDRTGEVPAAYDSLIAKLVVWGPDRDTARARLRRALDELIVEGVVTTAAFHRLAVDHEQFVAATHATVSVEADWDLSALARGSAASGSGERVDARVHDARPPPVVVEVDDRRFEVRVDVSAPRRRVRRTSDTDTRHDGVDLRAPMQGTLVDVAVAVGQTVDAGDVVVVLEAMKMETPVHAHRGGTVTAIGFDVGDVAPAGAVLARIE